MKFKESKSIYLQIADRICDEILQGQYPEEERIPSVREYAGTVEVNANTVVRTYDYLQGLEIIYNKRGIGYFVSTGAKERIITLRKDTFLHEDLPEFFRQLKTLEISMDEIDKMYKKYLEQQIVTQTHFFQWGIKTQMVYQTINCRGRVCLPEYANKLFGESNLAPTNKMTA